MPIWNATTGGRRSTLKVFGTDGRAGERERNNTAEQNEAGGNHATERLGLSAVRIPAGTEPWWPHGWWKIMDMRIGIIPIPVYVILFALLAGFAYTGDVKGEVSVMIAVLVIGGFTCAEIGKRMPILRNIGAGGDLRDLHPVRAGLLQAAADARSRSRSSSSPSTPTSSICSSPASSSAASSAWTGRS